MALDIYAGTMTRFYRREWENAAQRISRERGMQYERIYAGGPPAPPPPAEEIREAVAAWCQALSASLAPHGCGSIGWSEADEQPYFTDRLGWEGYCALLLWTAHAEHPDLPLPTEVPESWILEPAYEQSIAPEFRSRFRTILQAQLWLPNEFPFVFKGPTLVSEEKTFIGSVFTLKQELDDLYGRTSEQLERLGRARCCSEPIPKRPSMLSRLLGRRPPDLAPQKPSLAEAAQFGLSNFRELAAKACEHRLPILLDC